jgi:uncharacterized protein (TIGR02996 family)
VAIDAAERVAMLRAVLAAPEDDGPRLVMADWLEEHGESDRAEFIRVQCQQELEPVQSPEWLRLVDRSRELLPDSQRGLVRFWEWFGTGWWQAWGGLTEVALEKGYFVVGRAGVPSRRWSLRVARGFVGEVILPPSEWIKYGRSMVAYHPITRVDLTATAPRLGANTAYWNREDVPRELWPFLWDNDPFISATGFTKLYRSGPLAAVQALGAAALIWAKYGDGLVLPTDDRPNPLELRLPATTGSPPEEGR